jgi:hypothetical protein
MNRSRAGNFFLVLAVTIISCNKTTNPIPEPKPTENKFVVNLVNSIVKTEDIDSANIVFKKQGSFNPVFQRLIKNTNTLETTIDGLSAGEWTAELDLYTRKQANGKSYEHIASKPFTITSGTGTISIDGPTMQTVDGWKKRLVLSTSDNDIVVIIPVDVTDPYFEIRTSGLQWNFFSVERTAVSGTAVVANKKWVCNNDCPGNDRLIYNSNEFIPFTDIIKTSSWTRNDIVISVGNLRNQEFNDFVHEWNF